MVRRPDDCTIPPDSLRAVRGCADRLLRESGAYGQHPTPIPDIIAAANLSVERNASLDVGFLKKLYGTTKQTIKRALDKVLGLFDSRDGMIYLDLTLKRVKERFVSLHETGHGYLPWQRHAFAFMEDGEKHLDADVQQQFECEASIFASEVLFQGPRFQEEARSLPFDLKTPMQLGKKYGASNYAAFRRFVSQSHRICTLLVFEQPVYEVGRGYAFHLRRAVSSGPFLTKFGELQWPNVLYTGESALASRLPMRAFHRIFTKKCRIPSPILGYSEAFYLEAFDSTYQVFALLIPESELRLIKLAS
jgi:Zn-dependent peptidase ImmA (M78 family)